jgi:hypothetical protein
MGPMLAVDRRGFLAHHPLGASTGYMSDRRGDWPALVAQAVELSPFAAELSVLSEAEVDGLSRFLASRPSLPFRYLSVHGPSKGRVMPEPDLIAALLELTKGTDCVVMHPDVMEDSTAYECLGRKLVLENMDTGKRDGCTVDQLERWFAELPQAGFCLDIAHAWSVDPTMGLASELLDAFRSRLRHLHLSSLSSDLHHVPLTHEDEELFMPILERCLDLPWILEAPPKDI